jgi:hypothetical protein
MIVASLTIVNTEVRLVLVIDQDVIMGEGVRYITKGPSRGKPGLSNMAHRPTGMFLDSS